MVFMPSQNVGKNDDDKDATLPSNLVTSSYSDRIVYDTTGSFIDFSGYKVPPPGAEPLEGVDPSHSNYERVDR